MKRFFRIGLATLFIACFSAQAVEPAHLYGFILSCGKTIYRTFDHPLSDAELLEWTDYFEETECLTEENPDPGIRP